MINTPEGLSPLAAYEELMRFARRRGEAALRLALHASVPQGFQPELLHLLKRNFVPEAADDPTTEVDVLFSPLCEDMGGGYFQFDHQVRMLLLDNLVSSYSPEPRLKRVANFLLSYIDHFERTASESQDQLWKDYLEIQRWVALAFINPEGVALELAKALERADSGDNFAIRIQLGGLASALSAPLIGYRHLLTYAAGLQALELGDNQKADELLRNLKDDEIKIGDLTLRPASQIINNWYERHPDISPPSPDSKQAPEERPETSAPPNTIEELLAALTDGDRDARIGAAEALSELYATDVTVPALAGALNKDPDLNVRQAVARCLGWIGNTAAINALLQVVKDNNDQVRSTALTALSQIDDSGRNVVLVVGNFTEDNGLWESLKNSFRNRSSRKELDTPLGVIEDSLRHSNYLPAVFKLQTSAWMNLSADIANLLHLSAFLIIDLSDAASWAKEIKTVVAGLTIPVLPIADKSSSGFGLSLDLLSYNWVLPIYQYKGVDDLRAHFDWSVIAPLEEKALELLKEEPPTWPTPPPPLVREFEYDIFISYAHLDNQPLAEGQKGWVDTFHERLSMRLAQLTGEEVRIWRDPKLAGNDYFGDALITAIHKAALMVSIISPGYVRSAWSMKELEEFIKAAELQGGLQVGNSSRIFKVIKSYVPREEHPSMMSQMSGYEFYKYDEKHRRPVEFSLDDGPRRDNRYWEKLDDLAYDISRTLQALETGKVSLPPQPRPEPSPVYPQAVYLAETTTELVEQRERIKHELLERGYRVLPEVRLPLAMPELERTIPDYLRECVLSVHLIGGWYGMIPEGTNRSLAELQYEFALERSRDPQFSCMVWMEPQLSTENVQQRLFIDQVENADHIELLQTHVEELKYQILRKLRSKTTPPSPSTTKSIYLIYDRMDAEAIDIRPMQKYLLDRGFAVLTTPHTDDEVEVREWHKEALLTCDAVLIYWGATNEVWLRFKLQDLMKLPAWGRSEPLLAKAVYIGGEPTRQKELFRMRDTMVIRNFERFNPQSLEPFVDALLSAKNPGGQLP